MKNQHNNKEKIVLVINDGLGFNRNTSSKILEECWDSLDHGLKKEIKLLCSQYKNININHIISPIISEQIDPNIKMDLAKDITITSLKIRKNLGEDKRILIRSVVRDISKKHKYIPWVSKYEKLEKLRNEFWSWPTRAYGTWAGFEDSSPTIQGNSETGHQQIGNLTVAKQITMEINESINNHNFNNNNSINYVIDKAINTNNDIIISTLLSGTRGDDGGVHSSWKHLEAILNLIFIKKEISPKKIFIHAILDGRDSYELGSVKIKNDTGNYLGKLRNLLKKYKAENSLRWIVGRSIAMDRDYREESAKKNYNLLTKGSGKKIINISKLRKYINSLHESGMTDQDIPPTIILNNNETSKNLESGDTFINLNFRADRQIIITSSLSNTKNILIKESNRRQNKWKLDWVNTNLKLNICTMTEYHPELSNKQKIRVAFNTKSQKNNFFSKWDTFSTSKYILIAESVKSAHMGYFIRGRREKPNSINEDSHIIKTFDKSYGIESDTDFYKVPRMKNIEISEFVIKKILENQHQLIACNLAATDMLGHLLPKRYREGIEAYESNGEAIYKIARCALKNDYKLIITSDHGNIEDNTSSHTSNDILTTLVGNNSIEPISRKKYIINLYDICPTIAKILNFKPDIKAEDRSSYNGYAFAKLN